MDVHLQRAYILIFPPVFDKVYGVLRSAKMWPVSVRSVDIAYGLFCRLFYFSFSYSQNHELLSSTVLVNWVVKMGLKITYIECACRPIYFDKNNWSVWA